ncbi:pyruvate dehydrogenase complex protein X component [Magnaporthiopsis poae ATCC 64411]|uniref:Pyruvate dehydrogenase complex protein X component n=1 Tax=Magnaporthiopsis poae (strain ATCC 64411 / 73-15) TaxID=644358 RepID=A0A0C4E389_MAGP6|nr:pyruvate dehydrogenase complex protein X component [Magnaporthiopsis poae ATCC 64411]
MATLAALGRMSGRLNRRRLARAVVTPRGFRTSATALAAQNFTMPALSPTMTEGNIAAWRVKEGDKFSAGDVLLEIETDKATMDVEAQDEGILMKIMQGDGAKAIKVGARIAVLAEDGDDISALEIPPDESGATAAKETQQKQPKRPARQAPTPSSPCPAFISLTVPKTEEKRAKAFLERFKLVIEEEPENLVLLQ